MIVTDARFVLLFLLCWGSFFLMPRSWRGAVLASGGIVFYLVFAGGYLPLFLVFTAATLWATRPVVAWVVGLAIVAVLAYFKWIAAATIGPAGQVAQAAVTSPLVPLGLSFLAFELLHVLIDRRRGRLTAVSAVDLFAFAFFFPCRIAGPIRRYRPFVEAVEAARASFENVYAGLVRILIGLAKKLLLADVLALTVAEQAQVTTPARAWSVALAFSFQIWLDFSAYSDIAIGLARILGIAVPENFDRPYLAPNVRRFWDRWHMTLSGWVREYVFTPTGHRLFKTSLRKRPLFIAVLSYLITFVVVGAWHGLAIGFLVWGTYHGVLLAGYHAYRAHAPAWFGVERVLGASVARYAATGATFLLVTVGWVPFMTDWTMARKLLTLMFGGRP